MRCYHFGNFYLSSIQQGIQAAHAQVELFIKYDNKSDQTGDLVDWARNHKTMICLNGGMASDLEAIARGLSAFEESGFMNFAWSTFSEEDAALNGAMTNVAIILPEKMYVPKLEDITSNSLGEFSCLIPISNNDTQEWFYNPCDRYIKAIMDSCGLAR